MNISGSMLGGRVLGFVIPSFLQVTSSWFQLATMGLHPHYQQVGNQTVGGQLFPFS